MTKAERLLYRKMKREIYDAGPWKIGGPRKEVSRATWRLYKTLEARHDKWMAKVVANDLKVGEDITGKDINAKDSKSVPSGFVDEPDKYDDFAYVPANPVALGLVETESERDGRVNR
jgi:hypothetical protein